MNRQILHRIDVTIPIIVAVTILTVFPVPLVPGHAAIVSLGQGSAARPTHPIGAWRAGRSTPAGTQNRFSCAARVDVAPHEILVGKKAFLPGLTAEIVAGTARIIHEAQI